MEKQIKSKKRVVDHGEVFTAEREVNAMLDLVEQETRRVDSRFLEPACGDGNFLAEILRRKLEEVRRAYRRSPADYEKNAILAVSCIYGVDLMMDNVLACRERLFGIWDSEYTSACGKEASRQARETVRLILSRGIICGNALTLMCVDPEGSETQDPIVFSEWSFPTGTRMLRKDHTLDALLNSGPHGPEGTPMAFDVIIGNPPYQLNDRGNGVSATPIFQHFVSQAVRLNARYVSMIIPARWYAGGKGLHAFRKKMLSDRHIRKLVDFESSKDCFAGVNIAGGICYFLRDREYEGDCEITNVLPTGDHTAKRPLGEFPILIRSNLAVSIVRKIMDSGVDVWSDHAYPRNPFGFATNYRGRAERRENDIEILSSVGFGYVDRGDVKRNTGLIDHYKVLIGRLVPSNGELDVDPRNGYKVITDTRIIGPGQINTETYLDIGVFKTLEEALHFEKFLRSKLPRFLLRQAISSLNVSRECFRFVPCEDFTEEWTDGKLYKKYGLTEEEIAFVESTIRPMEQALPQ